MVIVPEIKIRQNFQCLEMSVHKPPLGSQVMALGMPSAAYRGGNGRDASGYDLQISSGNVVQTDSCVQKTYSTETGGLPPTDIKLKSSGSFEAYNDSFVQVTADTMPGSSGGALIYAGKISAVTSFGDYMLKTVNSECPGATFFESLEYLPRMANEAGLSAEIEQLKCTSKKFEPLFRDDTPL